MRSFLCISLQRTTLETYTVLPCNAVQISLSQDVTSSKGLRQIQVTPCILCIILHWERQLRDVCIHLHRLCGDQVETANRLTTLQLSDWEALSTGFPKSVPQLLCKHYKIIDWWWGAWQHNMICWTFRQNVARGLLRPRATFCLKVQHIICCPNSQSIIIVLLYLH